MSVGLIFLKYLSVVLQLIVIWIAVLLSVHCDSILLSLISPHQFSIIFCKHHEANIAANTMYPLVTKWQWNDGTSIQEILLIFNRREQSAWLRTSWSTYSNTQCQNESTSAHRPHVIFGCIFSWLRLVLEKPLLMGIRRPFHHLLRSQLTTRKYEWSN